MSNITYTKDGVTINDGTPITTLTGGYCINPSQKIYEDNGWVRQVPIPLKKEWIQEKIHEQYSLDDEVALINNQQDEPEEYAAYQAFRATVKAQADQLVAEGKLLEQ